MLMAGAEQGEVCHQQVHELKFAAMAISLLVNNVMIKIQQAVMDAVQLELLRQDSHAQITQL